MKAKAKPKPTKKVAAKSVTLQGVVEDIKALSFEDRKALSKIVSEAHSKDLEKYGGGGDPDGEGYKL